MHAWQQHVGQRNPCLRARTIGQQPGAAVATVPVATAHIVVVVAVAVAGVPREEASHVAPGIRVWIQTVALSVASTVPVGGWVGVGCYCWWTVE